MDVPPRHGDGANPHSTQLVEDSLVEIAPQLQRAIAETFLK